MGDMRTFKDLATIQTSNQQDIRESLVKPNKITRSFVRVVRLSLFYVHSS